jgi:hypothetical protein
MRNKKSVQTKKECDFFLENRNPRVFYLSSARFVAFLRIPVTLRLFAMCANERQRIAEDIRERKDRYGQMVSMKIPAKDTDRAFYIARRNVKGVLRYACYWTDTNAYVRDERTSANDPTFVYNPQVFSSTYEKTLTKMRAIFPNATLTEYAGTDAQSSATNARPEIVPALNVATLRGQVTQDASTQDVPAVSVTMIARPARNVKRTYVANPAYRANVTEDVPAQDVPAKKTRRGSRGK